MSIKYICILALISILETQIESKVNIQNGKNILPSRSLDNVKKINVDLPKEHKTASHVHKMYKKFAKYNSLKLPQNHYKPSLKSLPYFEDTTLERQHKSSKIYPVYSDYQNDGKKRQKSSGSSSVNMKLPKPGKKNSKLSKKLPIRNRYSKVKKIHQKFEKGFPKKHKHLSKLDKNESKIMNTPSIYLKPPEIGEKNFYNSHKRRISLKSSKKPSNSVNDHLKGEENRPEKNQHYVRDHEPIHQNHSEANKNNNDEDNTQEELSQEMDNSADDENRVDFHIQGHDGPDSYVFGFDTGKGDNRQFRWEQRHINGTVTGQYGYYDPRGKFKKVFYRSDPFLGYQVY